MKLKPYILFFIGLMLGAVLCGLVIFVKDLPSSLRETSKYTFSSRYDNATYAFSLTNLPEGWTVEQTESSPPQEIYTKFSWTTGVPDANFDVLVATEPLEIGGITSLGQSNQYYYYYSFVRYPFECSYYTSPADYAERGRCEATEDVWDALENAVLPGFSILE